ncbi:MAG: glycosyltransferase [Planctomycetaceae bacterium]|jgi:glycosyltransferase involved in cell wall biosynthesis|nr:glycosyltransferase [Planctomycetaceae bacterium]
MTNPLTPIVTIIIPVYNVELYLRECLDSVVNQTLRNIQIVCVNDGSTDGSFAILEEYAAKDPRILLINGKNSGLSAARNTAITLAKGEYIYFIDSDDWAELTLCEKAYNKAVQSGADITFFFFRRCGNLKGIPRFDKIPLDDKTTPEEKSEILEYAYAWTKLYSTGFLKKNRITFPVNLCFEDVLFHWKTMVLADKVAVLPETLYNYRIRSGSILENRGENYCDIVPIYGMVKKFLQEQHLYETYKTKFLQLKYWIFQINYQHLRSEFKPKMLEMIRKSVQEDELDWWKGDVPLRGRTKDFLAALTGSKIAKFRYALRILLFHMEKPFVRFYLGVLHLLGLFQR